jgi:hypothetical protein
MIHSADLPHYGNQSYQAWAPGLSRPERDPSISSLLEIAGRPAQDGRYPFNLSGSLAKPILKPGA